MRISDLSLQQRCLNAVIPSDRERGARYFNRRRVSLGAREAGGIGATIEGSGDAVYEVRLDWSEAASSSRLAVRCSCPRFADYVACKHVWATIVAFDAARFDEPVPGKGALRLELVLQRGASATTTRAAPDPDPEVRGEQRTGPVGRVSRAGRVSRGVPRR